MPVHEAVTAVFPGMFDPVTYGHLDIIRRGRRLFDRLIVAVGHNPAKTELFTQAERVEMLSEVLGELPRVEMASYKGLTVEFVRRIGAQVILRGIRDTVDLRAELQAANTNLIVGEVETVFLMTSDQHALTSSTLIKQCVAMGQTEFPNLNRFVPDAVLAKLRERLARREDADEAD